MKRLHNKLALVTGGGSGIGQATALAFAREGARLILVDINEQGLQVTASQITGLGGEVETHIVNVADANDMAALADTVHQQHGALDILVNNAGIAAAGCFLDTTLDAWDKVLDINLKGVVHGCHFFLPAMVAARNQGIVVNTASAASFVAPRDMSIYATSKFAVFGFSESLRCEMAEHNIQVTVICPGIVNTPLISNTLVEGDLKEKGLREKAVSFYEKRNYPPEKVAQAILRGVIKRRSVVPVSPEAWASYFAKRFVPGFVEWVGRRDNPLIK